MQKEILFNIDELNYIDSLWVKDKTKNFNDRLYESCYIKIDSITNKLLKWFEVESGERLQTYDFDLILHRYDIGNYFAKHIDNVERYNKNRAYVVGFHINNDYKGGEYKLYNPDEIIDKTPGLPYFFKSDRIHEITKIEFGIRKSALIFINYEDLIKTNLL